MDELQGKLDSILSNPQMMQQIMSMAQAMGQSQPTETAPAEETSVPIPDAAMLQKIAGIACQSGVDSKQQALLKALTPYLAQQRIHKLERAMRAAKIASMAASVIGSGGLSFLTGR